MATGTLSTAGQHDWLAVDLTAGKAYLFTIAGLDAYSGITIGAAGALDDSPLSTVLAFPDGTATTSKLFYEPATTGTYYIDISDDADLATYTVTAAAVAFDYADNASTAGTVAIGGVATTGTLRSQGQQDWLKLSLTANQGYLFTVTGLDQYASLAIGAAGTLSDAVLSAVEAINGGTASTNEIFYEPSVTGTYFIDIGDNANTATYHVSGAAVATDYADNASTTGTVAIGGAATTGTLSTPGQHDWLKLSLTADQGYLFKVTGLDQSASLVVGAAGALNDTLLFNAEATSGGTVGTSEVFYEPAATGTYFIDISDNANTAGYGVTGVTVATDVADNASTTGTVAIGGPATTGTLGTPGQHDWLKLSLIANQGYLFTVTGLDQHADLSVGAAGTLDDSALATVQLDSGGRTGTSEVFYEPAATGTYFIDISDDANTASYSVTGAEATTDYTDNASTTGTVAIGGAATTGTLSTPGQHDWLKLSLTANQGYLFTVTGLDLFADLVVGTAATMSDSLLSKVAVFGVGTADTSEAFYEPSATGTYFIDISDHANTAGYSVTGIAVPTDDADNATTTGVVTACFAAGTRIAAERGDIAVERLRAGDRVMTRHHGLAAVVWLGFRSVSCARHPRPCDVWPVRVRAGAFGVGRPMRDLLLSPDHAVFIDGVLIPIRYLINGRTIAQEQWSEITYWHVELPEHDVVFAEGLAAESYLDTGNRAAFANGGRNTPMHPDFARGAWDRRACAPLIMAGAELEVARHFLLLSAADLGHATTDDPDIRVIADGRAARRRIDGRRMMFDLPPGAARARIVSRHGVPAETTDHSDDHRSLGVAVAAIMFDGMPVPLNDPALGPGWHAVEHTAGTSWRWTDGDAIVAVRGAVLELRIAMTARYWADRPPHEMARAA